MRAIIQRANEPTSSFFDFIQESPNIATEGFFDNLTTKVQEFFDDKEKELHQFNLITKDNVQTLTRLTSKLEGKKQLRSDALPVLLKAYAKWIAVNSTQIDNGEQLIKELERMRDVALFNEKHYLPNLLKYFKYVTTEVIDVANANYEKAAAAWENSLDELYPTEARQFLTMTREGQSCSSNFLGDWFIQGTKPIMLNKPTKALVLEAKLNRQFHPVASFEFKPLTPEQVRKIFDIAKEITTTFDHIHVKLQKDRSFAELDMAVDRFCVPHDSKFRQYSYEEKAKWAKPIHWSQTAMQRLDFLDMCDLWISHTLGTVLKLCEGSIRRME